MRTSVVACIAALGLATVTTAAAAKPARPGRRALNLFASSGLLLEANRTQCGIDNVGQVCVAFSGSPVGGGGFWPKGTHDQYIFNSGLQLAAVVDPAAGFSWAGDTTGAWFFDPRGDQASGDPLGSIYNSLDPVDYPDAWPNGAIIRDASIYDPALLGQKKISDGDSWVRYWEGNPIQLGGREHPMGIMVEQRSMAWNFPVGNEDILYFVFTFYNVTARNASAYAGLDPAIQAEVAAVGAQFQDLNETKFGINIPDAGYTLTDLFAAFAMDADVAVFDHNYSTAFLPFNIGSTYSGDWLPEVGWTFPNTVFGPPFFPGPGFVGVKYLRSPESSPGVEVGLTMFSNTTNGGAFPDAVGDHLLYRRLSGFIGAADVQCNSSSSMATARALRLCYLAQTRADARFYQASGPFDLAPGQSATIVVAYIHAAPVSVPGIVIGGDLAPGIPATGDTLFFNPSRVRLIDRIAGWVSASDENSNQRIDQAEVVTTPRSLLDKALKAQAVFDAKFLLPNAPAAPQFFLVPGDNSATVVWQPSATETDGDLYFNIASRPYNIDTAGDSTQNPLYDPNFRRFDVEGYRIYRGRSSSELELIAQFDKTGTTFVDFTGAVSYGDLTGDGLVQCAPELGLQVDCPVTFDTSYVKTTGFETDLNGELIQVKAGERTELRGADSVVVDSVSGDTVIAVRRGSVVPLIADTAVTGNASGFPAINNSGVAFAFVDNNVRNGFTYQYTVTAFDVNSVKSGPTSLESAKITEPVTPRRPSGQETAGTLVSQQLGAAGQVLDVSAPVPAFDGATGQFAGPMPPADGIQLSLAAFVPQVLATGDLTVKIDSIAIGVADQLLGAAIRPTLYYVTVATPAGTSQHVLPIQYGGFDENRSVVQPVVVTSLDSAKAARFGGDDSYSVSGLVSLSAPGNWELSNWGRGYANAGDFPDFEEARFNGPRLWLAKTGNTVVANEDTPNPNGGQCTSSNGAACGNSAKVPDITLTAGKITGYTIWHPSSYYSTPNSPGRLIEVVLATITRAADFRIYWGAAGVVDSVIDITHQVPVAFSPRFGPTWGILNQASFAATNQATTGDGKNGLLTWADMFCVAPVPVFFSAVQATFACGGTAQTPAVLQNSAALSPIAIRDTLSSYAGTAAAGYTATGTGFALYLNGHFFFVQGTALPAQGDVWGARFYAGVITGTAGDLSFRSEVRPPNVPGLRAQLAFEGSEFNPTTTSSEQMASIHTVPDPYYVTNSLEASANQKVLNFVNLPAQSIVRIYSLSGVLVNVLTHSDVMGGGQLTWNLRNRNNQFVASGVYFYHVEAPDGKTKVGRFTVVNFAP